MQLLTDTEIKKWKPKGNNTRARCGPKLYVRGFETGRKLFQMRFDADRKTRWLDVADYPAMSLSGAREIAAVGARLIKANDCTVESLRVALSKSDTAMALENRIKARDVALQQTNNTPTFDAAYREWYALQVKANRWTNNASQRRPIKSYELHAERHLGSLPLDRISRPTIKKFMQPLFMSSEEVASKLLGYITEVLEVAYDDELIDGNPCPRKSSFTIPKRNTRHAASLHYSRLPELIQWLRSTPFSQPVKVAMQLAIVTAHRASVVANMRWEHVDAETGIWTVPERDVEAREVGLMKSGHSFSSKLPPQLCEALRVLKANQLNDDFVFSVDGRKPINAETLRRNFQKFDAITTHGFRNTFKTWCLNQEPPVDIFLVDRYCDHALTGLDKNYRRDDMFDQRAALAKRYCVFVMGE